LGPTYIISISFARSDYGQWTAFLALLVRLFFFIPGRVIKEVHIRLFIVNFFVQITTNYFCLF
jgi:hypothetical protein